jgi:hypothetical protein
MVRDGLFVIPAKTMASLSGLEPVPEVGHSHNTSESNTATARTPKQLR